MKITGNNKTIEVKSPITLNSLVDASNELYGMEPIQNRVLKTEGASNQLRDIFEAELEKQSKVLGSKVTRHQLTPGLVLMKSKWTKVYLPTVGMIEIL